MSTYKEILDEITSAICERGQIQPAAPQKFLNSNESDFNKFADLVNYLISKNMLRFGLPGYSSYTTTVTWTRLGIEFFKDCKKLDIILEDFKKLYNIENEE